MNFNSINNIYTKLAATELVSTGVATPAAMTEFANILNTLKVDTADPLYTVTQTLFRANRRGYLSCIRGTANEAFVLLTDMRTVIGWFRLSKVVFIKQKNDRYWVNAIQSKDISVKFPTFDANGQVV